MPSSARHPTSARPLQPDHPTRTRSRQAVNSTAQRARWALALDPIFNTAPESARPRAAGGGVRPRRIDIAAQGKYFKLVTGTPFRDDDVRLEQSGRGLSHVLPIVVTALSARGTGPGADVIEHPEAELHPAAHADVAELLLANLAGAARPLIVETHSEMVLLRTRRWVAEGRLPAGHVLVYRVHADAARGSLIEKIGIRENGEMETTRTGGWTVFCTGSKSTGTSGI